MSCLLERVAAPLAGIFGPVEAALAEHRPQSSCLPPSPSPSTPLLLAPPLLPPHHDGHLAYTTASRHGEQPSTSPIQGRLKTSPKRPRVSRVIQLSVWSALVNSFFVTSDTLLNNYMFDGARADLSKSLSMNPGFNVTHSFTLGSQTAPPAYHFGAIFANEKVRIVARHLVFPIRQHTILIHTS